MRVGGVEIGELCAMSIPKARNFLQELELDQTRREIVNDVLLEILERLSFLEAIGWAISTPLAPAEP